jgi:hypothetical protein
MKQNIVGTRENRVDIQKNRVDIRMDIVVLLVITIEQINKDLMSCKMCTFVMENKTEQCVFSFFLFFFRMTNKLINLDYSTEMNNIKLT